MSTWTYRFARGAKIYCAVISAALALSCGENRELDDTAPQAEPETPALKQGRTDDSQQIMREFGQCTKHEDCAEDAICAAVTPGNTECVVSPALALEYKGEGAVPNIPPLGVLDGSVRQFSEGAAP